MLEVALSFRFVVRYKQSWMNFREFLEVVAVDLGIRQIREIFRSDNKFLFPFHFLCFRKLT